MCIRDRHEPLIDRMSFDIVQNKLKSRQRPGQTNEISLFAGLLKCGECGKSLTVRYTNACLLYTSPMTVKRSLNELETAGRIMRVRQGVGEPNRIYVLIPGKEDAALA